MAFRILLGLMFVVVLGYTLVVGNAHGWSLLPIFFGAIASFSWQGQFNLDFSCFLLLAGLWIAWRHHFSPAGLALGFLGALVGAAVVAPYLLIASVRTKGDMAMLLLGERRAFDKSKG